MWDKVIWPDEIKIILFGTFGKNPTLCLDHTERTFSTMKHGGGSIILCGLFFI